MQMQAECERQREGPRPFLELIMATIIGAAALPERKRKGINIRMSQEAGLSPVQARLQVPDLREGRMTEPSVSVGAE